MEEHIKQLAHNQTDENVNKIAGTFETQNMEVLETQVNDMLKADRNIQSALLTSDLDTVSFTMIHPNGINSKIIVFKKSYCFPCRVVSYQGGNQICLAPAYRIKV